MGLYSCRRNAKDFFQSPTLVLAKRAALDDSNHIPFVGFSVFIVRHEFGALGNDPLVHRMLHAPTDFHHNRLLHFGAFHNADFFLMMPGFFYSPGGLFSHGYRSLSFWRI